MELNEEYEGRRVLAKPPPLLDTAKRIERKRRTAKSMARHLSRFVDLRGKKVLDFGCGRGDLDLVLAEHLDCEVTGVDGSEYTEWAGLFHAKVRRLVTDLSQERDQMAPMLREPAGSTFRIEVERRGQRLRFDLVRVRD